MFKWLKRLTDYFNNNFMPTSQYAHDLKFKQIKIKYFDKDMPELNFILGKSDWIDVRSKDEHEYKAGDFIKVYLGVAMQLPEGYEAHTAPRGSTYKNYGLIQTNSVGVVDESFKGDNDEWFIPMFALRDGKINKYDRIAQFRIMEKMPKVKFTKVERLENKDRGGHGSTGVK